MDHPALAGERPQWVDSGHSWQWRLGVRFASYASPKADRPLLARSDVLGRMRGLSYSLCFCYVPICEHFIQIETMDADPGAPRAHVDAKVQDFFTPGT